ncbi:MAG TPA: ornithine cyclodeaminase family protein [Gemmatimonadaceae bacterium]|nr:ornithine cyclodeaminase family protein [Gemmatimonadaceae bacterium]
MIVLSQRDIGELLSMRDCIGVMAGALGALARGESLVPLRTVVRLPGGSDVFALMPAVMGDPPALGAKIITVFHGNHGTAYDSHQGAVLLFDAANGSLTAVLDATAITSIRTAAVSALATRLLARGDADDLAILGSGVQARMHLEAIPLVRRIRRVRIWSRNRKNAEKLLLDTRAVRGDAPFETIICDTAEEAVRDASIVCATTSAHEPVLLGRWVAAGAHVNAVGACTPRAREIDSEMVKRARLFVDSRVSALNEAGDIITPIQEGDITPDHIVAELGEVIAGLREGRRSPTEVTLFESLGLAIEDLAAARHVHALAESRPVGTIIDLGGSRHAPA